MDVPDRKPDGLARAEDRDDAGRRLKRFGDDALSGLGLLLFVAIPPVVLLQMLSRWILNPYFGMSLVWTKSLSQLLLAFLTFIGAAIASRDREHIVITFLIDRLPARIRVGVEALQSVLIVTFLVIFVYGGVTIYDVVAGRQYQILPRVPPFTREWIYFVAVGASILMVVYAVRDLRETLRGEPEVSTDVSFNEHD
jgi:TRAP-type C4-dicarboxylate transport system permease small subunit